MGSIRVRKDSGLLFFDFRYQSNRCREQSMQSDTATNRRNMEKVLARIESEIKLGTFDYDRFFPNSPLAAKFKGLQEGASIIAETGPMTILTTASQQTTPFFSNFAEEWFLENEIRWKRSYKKTQRTTINKYLLPHFGEKEISRITKGDILKFRSSLAKVQNGANDSISTDRINHIMTPLRMILDEAADRYNFNTPYIGIKQLRVPKSDVYPFSLEEVKSIIANVRKDFANYFTVRFLTGMRTSEIDGLKWEYVDFSKRVICIRETLVDGLVETTKTPESVRDISMSQPVFDAMTLQFEVTKDLGGYVFCHNDGVPLARR
ncbi:MAG: Arm DNA-binding domain-containing protein, partial [Desulfuromonadaceae bacterium]